MPSIMSLIAGSVIIIVNVVIDIICVILCNYIRSDFI